MSITVFTIISTIYPAIVSPDKDNNNNINREIIKLRNNLSLPREFPFNNFDDYQNISKHYNTILAYNKSNIQINNTQIFMSILAYREGKILNNSGVNDSTEHYLKRYIKNSQTKLKDIEPTNITWYPLRQLILANETILDDLMNEELNVINSTNSSNSKINIANSTNSSNSKTTKDFLPNNESTVTEKTLDENKKEFERIVNEIKEEEYFCNKLNNNSLYVDTYCSNDEIKKIIDYSKNFDFVINIMNDNSDSKISQITKDFRLFSDYFQWFILFSFVTGPIVFFAWMRNYIE